MRIISGLLKGKSINFLKNSKTRPLKDSVKENIFNILKHSKLINVKLEKANILDLYSGIGSFGIESISRGADKVVFVEQDEKAANTLNENLIKLSISHKGKIINNKIEKMLENINSKKFNIIFLDPPFADKEFIKVINLIKEKNIYEKKHIIIIHRERKSKDKLDNFLKIRFYKNYGRSKIIFGYFN
jgi:16S rRNA (guanine966-N2)-methyltransferase